MSERATQLIAENRKTKAPFLDLGNCGLKALPPELGELTWLESLGLGSSFWVFEDNRWKTQRGNNGPRNQIDGRSMSALKPLTQLTSLSLVDLPIADISFLADLPQLRSLDLGGVLATDFSVLGTLLKLQVLDVARTRLSDLTPLAGLSDLRALNLLSSQVSDLGPLTGLTKLQWLRVSSTEVSQLSPLSQMFTLKVLDLTDSNVSDLSPLRELIARGSVVRRDQGDGICISRCPLTTPPYEIAVRGKDAILNYFRELETGGVDHLFEAKVLILGEGGSGKTSLLRRLYQPERPLPAERETTRGIDIYRHHFEMKNGRRFRLNVWDFGGQEIYHATHQFFLTRRSLYVLLDDTRKDHRSVSDEGFKYWLDLIDVFGGHSPVLIFQNEKDGRSKSIDLAGIKGRFDNVKERYAGDLIRKESADSLRDGIEHFASTLSHVGEELPARWVRVRADIEQRAEQAPYISRAEYFDIYSRHLPRDETKALHLSRYLHDLGVFLHFQDDRLLRRTVILQNTWATEAVYRLLDDEAVKRARGRFEDADCERVWRDSRYDGMHPELHALMERFELCYQLPDTTTDAWLAPQLLSPTKPPNLAQWGEPGDLVLRYQYDFLPKGVISRLTVRLQRYVRNTELAWATGVLFDREGTEVLVEVLHSGTELELRARGAEQKAMLTVVAAELDALNNSFAGLRDKIDKRIPCNCEQCARATVPEFFAERNLRRRKQDGRLQIECPASYATVDVLQLLDGVKSTALPRWANAERSSAKLEAFRIFLASSVELRPDRDAFDLYVRQLTDHFRRRGTYIEVVRWETFLGAMSESRLQDEYNKAVAACDVFVGLFYTKTGNFTEEEFDTAHRAFKATGRPRIYTYFKTPSGKSLDARPEDIQSLSTFQQKLAALGHFWTGYEDIEHLKRQFRDQLDKLLE